jgi:hypothetical protein
MAGQRLDWAAATVAPDWISSIGHGAASVAWLDQAVAQVFTPDATETAHPIRLAATSAGPAPPTARARSTGMTASIADRDQPSSSFCPIQMILGSGSFDDQERVEPASPATERRAPAQTATVTTPLTRMKRKETSEKHREG